MSANKYGVLLICMALFHLPMQSQNTSIEFKRKPDQQEIEIWMNGQHFSSFLYHDALKKPVLYPLKTKSGKVLTRGFPFETRPGERIDHRHHLGHWLNYGDVNGVDFWNNSSDRPAEKRHKYGEIRTQDVMIIEPGLNSTTTGILYRANWVDATGNILLQEETLFSLQERGKTRIIDRKTILTAKRETRFTDNKEGMIAIRVRRELELPSDKPGWYADKAGKPLKEKTVSSTAANGDYLSSTGITGGSVWGTRASWMKLHGKIADEHVEIVIIDHEGNVGYPSYWHARGYGLFSANPLGQKVFSKGKEELNFKLTQGESTTFKYRILVHEGKPLSKKKIEKLKKEFEMIRW